MTDILSLETALLMIYVLITALFSFFIVEKMELKKFRAFLFIFVFNLVMNIAGFVFSTFLYLYFNREKRKKEMLKINYLDMEILTLSFPKIKMEYGEGPLENLLKNQRVPEDRKVEILSYLKNGLEPDDIRLFYETLSSKSDESRLLSFGKIGRMEKEINDKIEHILNKIKENRDKKMNFLYKKEIAKLYFEYFYYDLAQGDLKEFYLQKAVDFACESLDEKPNQSELYLLLGRIYLELKKYDKALSAFKRAMEDELLEENALPYIAQLYFETRDFRSLKKTVDKMKKLKYNPKVAIMTSLWSGDEY